MSDLGNKDVMAENIKYYMKKSNVTQTDLCNTLGFKMSTFSDWIHGRTYPRIDKIELMANYFGISKSDLVEDRSSSRCDDTYYLNNDTKEMAEFMFNNPAYKVLFDASKNTKPEDIKFVADMINRVNGNNSDI